MSNNYVTFHDCFNVFALAFSGSLGWSTVRYATRAWFNA